MGQSYKNSKFPFICRFVPESIHVSKNLFVRRKRSRLWWLHKLQKPSTAEYWKYCSRTITHSAHEYTSSHLLSFCATDNSRSLPNKTILTRVSRRKLAEFVSGGDILCFHFCNVARDFRLSTLYISYYRDDETVACVSERHPRRLVPPRH